MGNRNKSSADAAKHSCSLACAWMAIDPYGWQENAYGYRLCDDVAREVARKLVMACWSDTDIHTFMSELQRDPKLDGSIYAYKRTDEVIAERAHGSVIAAICGCWMFERFRNDVQTIDLHCVERWASMMHVPFDREKAKTMLKNNSDMLCPYGIRWSMYEDICELI